jgi:hypothetical protein
MTKTLLMFVVLSLFAACATTSSAVTWSDSMSINDAGGAYTLPCGDVASHPCARITHAHSAEVGSNGIRWYDFTGHDANGNPLSEFDTYDNGYTIGGVSQASDGSLVIAQAGDDIGLRWVATLKPTGYGWTGTISWQLEAEAGVGTMTVSLGE